jgi:Uma2 family endonuclease
MAISSLYAEEHILDKDWYTEDEYFALEDRSQERWEFLPDGLLNPDGVRLGRIRAMSGGTLDHSGIGGNLITALNVALRAASDGRNTYPDASVVCGRPVLYRVRRDIVTNLLLVAEVLSPSTEACDRGKKRGSYQTIPTLQHYLLIATDKARVELYTRAEGGWRLELLEGLEASFALTALGLSVALADLYSQIEFE